MKVTVSIINTQKHEFIISNNPDLVFPTDCLIIGKSKWMEQLPLFVMKEHQEPTNELTYTTPPHGVLKYFMIDNDIKVTLIDYIGEVVRMKEMLPKIMIREDTEISDYISRRFVEEGIDVLTNYPVFCFSYSLSSILTILQCISIHCKFIILFNCSEILKPIMVIIVPYILTYSEAAVMTNM